MPEGKSPEVVSRDPHLDPTFMSHHTQTLVHHTTPEAIRDVAEHRARMIEKILEGTDISSPKVQELADRLADEIRKAAEEAAKAVKARLATAGQL